jgi:hypothetical protein
MLDGTGPVTTTTIGVVGGTRNASVDGRGLVAPQSATWQLDWWIGADDRWRVPAREAAVRQQLVDGMPVVQTAMRVPSGDARHVVYGVPTADAGDVAVVEITNDSPAPFVAALVLHGAAAVELDGTTIYVDGRAAVRTARPPSRWAASVDGSTEGVVMNGDASEGPFPKIVNRGARIDAAFLYPVAHRTVLRAAVTLQRSGLGGNVDVVALPDGDAVARGWRAQLDRGMRVEVPDEQLQRALDTARAATVLAGHAWRVEPAVAAALEDWGLDDEAAVAWSRLSGSARRRLRRRSTPVGSWNEAFVRVGAPDAALLAAVRSVVARDADREIALITDWPEAWLGQPLDVRDAPTRLGPVSCSIRWHGERPALLWAGPQDTTFTAPGLDATWSSGAPQGEALLAPFTRRADGG